MITDCKSLPESAQSVTVAWFPRQLALSILGISSAQLRRDAALLKALGIPQFDYSPYDQGFTASAFEVLAKFRNLVRERGRRPAVIQIRQQFSDQN